jgi:hypothetical protein
MSEPLNATEREPTRGQFAYGLSFVGVVLAVLIGIPLALLAASASCACSSPVDLVVLNDAHEDGSVSWQGAGLLGTAVLGISGSATAPSCATLSQTLRPGVVSVSLRLGGGETRTVLITVPSGDARYGHAATFVIGADGRITGPADGAPSGVSPGDPLCD